MSNKPDLGALFGAAAETATFLEFRNYCDTPVFTDFLSLMLGFHPRTSRLPGQSTFGRL